MAKNKVNAKQFRRLSQYIRASESVLTKAVSDNALANAAGVNNRGVMGTYVQHDELSNREKKRIQQIQDLNPLQRIALIGQVSLYGGVFQEMNKFLLPKKQLPLKRIKNDSELPKGRRGFALSKNRYAIEVIWKSSKRISYARYPHAVKYRDPKQAKRYNFHWGASKKFPRYGIVSVTVLGKNTAAGHKGTELEGLGKEPIGYRPKAQATKYRYKPFKRVGYPGRSVPDRVTIKHRHPVYTEFFDNRTLSKPVLDKVKKDGIAFARAYAKRQAAILAEMAKKANDELLS